MCGIDATCVKFINVGIVYLPNDITIGITCLGSSIHCESTNALHTCSSHLAEASTIDVTFCIVIIIIIGGIIHTCQIKNIKVSTCYRNGRMRTYDLLSILMGSNMELLKPYITTNMVIIHCICCCHISCCFCYSYPLFYHTSMQNHWCR